MQVCTEMYRQRENVMPKTKKQNYWTTEGPVRVAAICFIYYAPTVLFTQPTVDAVLENGIMMTREEYLQDRVRRLTAALNEATVELNRTTSVIVLKNDALRAENMARIAAGQPIKR